MGLCKWAMVWCGVPCLYLSHPGSKSVSESISPLSHNHSLIIWILCLRLYSNLSSFLYSSCFVLRLTLQHPPGNPPCFHCVFPTVLLTFHWLSVQDALSVHYRALCFSHASAPPGVRFQCDSFVEPSSDASSLIFSPFLIALTLCGLLWFWTDFSTISLILWRMSLVFWPELHYSID